MRNFIYRLNIQQRLLIYFAITIIISISTVTWLIYEQAISEINKQSEDYLNYVVKNASYQTDVFINRLELATLPLLADYTIKSFLDLNTDEKLELYYHSNDIKKTMSDFNIKNENVNLIYILGDSEEYVFLNNKYEGDPNFLNEINYQDLSDMLPLTASSRLVASKSFYNDEFVVTLIRRVRGASSFLPRGILAVEINADSLEQIWNVSQFENGTSLWIYDEDNRIIYHPDQKWLGQTVSQDLLDSFMVEENNNFTGHWGEEEMIFNINRSPQTNWTIVAMTPKDVVYGPIAGLNNKVMIALAASFLLALIISSRFARSIVKPIRKVQHGLQKVEVGEWEKIKPLKGTDEISVLVASYNRMTEKMSTLIEDLHASEIKNYNIRYEKKMIELQALQSQINPHFLHNTLETINSYAILNDEEEISEMAVALSLMFRYSVRNLEVVRLQEEIEHVKNFLVIEEQRFQKKVNLTFDIEENLYDLEVAKLSLQPLIENIIHHGFRKKRTKGEIIIRAKAVKNLLSIEIIDNGSGITPERLQEIRNSLKETTFDKVNNKVGIGLTNVNRRIQLIFGDDCGLSIDSIPNQGTTVRMEIPQDRAREHTTLIS